MQPLGPGAFCEIFDDAGGEAAGNTERVDDLLGVELERHADTGGGAHDAENRGRVEAGFVHGLRHHGGEPAHRLGADRNADERSRSVRPVALASRQHRRHHHRAGMHRPAFEGVVEILAMRRGAVDEGGARRAHGARMPDCRAWSLLVEACERRLDVVLVARRDAKTGDVDQQILAFDANGGRQPRGIKRGNARCQLLGDRRSGAHHGSGHALGAEFRQAVGDGDDGEGDHQHGEAEHGDGGQGRRSR